MKKTLIVALMMMAGVTQAAVPCIVNPTSPVYHVDTYVRMQSACVKTLSAGAGGSAGAALGATVGFLGVVMAVVHLSNFIEYNKDEHKWLDYKVTWADGTTDFVRVRSEDIDLKEGFQKIRSAFAESDNPIKSMSWVANGKPEPTYIIQ